MQLRRSDDGPSVPRRIIKDLKAIDRGLEVRFYRCWPRTDSGGQGRPMLTRKTESGLANVGEATPIIRPRWHLYFVGDDGKAHWIRAIQNADKSFRQLDERTVRETRSDQMRVLGLREVLRRMQDEAETRQDMALKKSKELREEFLDNNKGKIKKVLESPFETEKMTKDTTIMSYAGQSNRSRYELPATAADKGYITKETSNE